MNKLAVVGCVLWLSVAARAFSPAEAYRIASYLIDRYTMSNEWTDNLDECHETEIEVEFPTATSLFSCEFPVGSVAAGLSMAEKQRAFDQFLSDFSQTKRADVSRAYEVTGSYALVFCAELGYTNGFGAATSILARADAPCRSEAYAVVRKLALPSIATSEYVYTLLTNQASYSVFDRNMLFTDYAARFKSFTESETGVLTNGVAMLRAAAPIVRAKIPLDDLLAAVCPTYAGSSNRLAYAHYVLSMPEVTFKEREYFSAVTNMLLSTKVPLQEVVLP